MRRKIARIAVVFVTVSTLTFSGCGDFFVSGGTLNNIVLSTFALFLSTNPSPESKQVTATGVNVDGTTSDVTNSVTWQSSDTSIVTVDSTGKITAVAPGSTTVTASKGSLQSTIRVLVAAGTLAQLTVNPSNFALTSAQTTFKLTATSTLGTGIVGPDLSSFVLWSSGNRSLVTVDQNGNVSLVTTSTTTTSQTVQINASITTATDLKTSSATASISVF